MKPTLLQLMAKCRIDHDGEGCWIWRGHVNKRGVPIVTWDENGRRVARSARRLMYELIEGVELPENIRVTVGWCADTDCIKREHAVAAKPKRTLAIARQQGRYVCNTPTQRAKIAATKQAASPLDWDKVEEIRASNESTHAIARRLGIHQATAQRVRAGKSWRKPSTALAVSLIANRML